MRYLLTAIIIFLVVLGVSIGLGYLIYWILPIGLDVSILCGFLSLNLILGIIRTFAGIRKNEEINDVMSKFMEENERDKGRRLRRR